MKTAWSVVGVAFYWLSWPLVVLLVPFTRRTRVFVRCDDEFLAVRTWHSPGDFSLPGGGIKPGETAELGAARELREETGISSKSLRYVASVKTRSRGVHSNIELYILDLDKKPVINQRAIEILAYKWKKLEVIASDEQLDPTIKQLYRVLQG